MKVEGQKVDLFDREGKQILPLNELTKALASSLEKERSKREKLEYEIAELQTKLMER